MLNNIDKVKILIEINNLIIKTAGIDPAVSIGLTEVYCRLSSKYGLDLNKTSPKKLYGKPYSGLTLEEKAEYTQIKRNIQRGVFR